ncbi:hypothetical protein GOODEAATRI_014733, partial [Goodea atripinnis]
CVVICFASDALHTQSLLPLLVVAACGGHAGSIFHIVFHLFPVVPSAVYTHAVPISLQRLLHDLLPGDVMTDVLGTIQFETSDPYVLIRLSVLDKEKEVAGNIGMGFVVLPVFFFLANKRQNSLGTLA